MTNTTANAIYTNADGTSEFVNLDETGCVYAIISQATEADLDALHAGEHADYRIASREIEVGDGDTYAMLQDERTTIMSTWTAPTSWLSRHYGTASDDVIAMHDEGPATALCWLGWRDGEPRVSLGILDERGAVYALSDDPALWDLIGQVVPRESWPGEMYAGKRVGEHDAPADLRALLDAAIAEYRADDEREVYSSITDVYPQILDLLGDDVEDFDVDAIAQEVTEWYDYLLPTGAIAAGSSGLRIRAEYADDVDALNAVLAKHCRTA